MKRAINKSLLILLETDSFLSLLRRSLLTLLVAFGVAASAEVGDWRSETSTVDGRDGFGAYLLNARIYVASDRVNWNYEPTSVQATFAPNMAALKKPQVTAAGNQNALGNLLRQAIIAIRNGNFIEAIQRTDGCALRGAPHGDGGGWDWILDRAVQNLIYNNLVAARSALQNLTSPLQPGFRNGSQGAKWFP